jgi:hypothetical protein
MRHRLSRLFARKSPGNFDQETGSWVDPDVILSPSDTVPAPPKPLVNNNCRQSHVVYSVVVNKVDTCNFAAKQQALSDAIAKAVTYFDKHFECRNKNCIKKVGEIIWTGVSCSQNPTAAFGAVLVRFRCELEL